MNTCKVLVPCGALGTGIMKEAFQYGMDMQPDIIACDAGSTDSGPYYLGTGKGKYARESVKEDMRLMMLGAEKNSIPITVGSCGTCGSDAGVDELAAICHEISEEEGISFNIAKIYTQQNPVILKEMYQSGKIHPLEAAPAITENTFSECTTIVGLAGADPFIAALKAGADIILCGRATDTAIIASFPIMKGCSEAAAWHGAKIAECGGLCTSKPRYGGVLLTFDEEGFTIEALHPDNSCTPYSVSAHMLYENANPYRMTEPSGTFDATNSVYTQLPGGKVRVTGTTFEHAPKLTMKLEGASVAGYQTISMVGIQDRRIMRNPQEWIQMLCGTVEERLKTLDIPDNYSYALKPYGWNAVSGAERAAGSQVPVEIGLMLVVTAISQELATKVAKVFNPLLLHHPVNQNEQLPSFAFPFSPAEIERGLIYEFRLNHTVELETPLDLVRIVLEFEKEDVSHDNH